MCPAGGPIFFTLATSAALSLMSFLMAAQAFLVAASSGEAAALVAGVVADLVDAVDPAEVAGFGSQPATAITAAMAGPIRTSLVQCIDVSPVIVMTASHATSPGQMGQDASVTATEVAPASAVTV